MMNPSSYIPPGAGQVNARDRTMVSRPQKFSYQPESMTAKQMIDRDRLNENTKEKLRQAFRQLDQNQDGQIDRNEMINDLLGRVVNKNNLHRDQVSIDEKRKAVEHVVDQLFAEFDTDHSGRISLEEFIEKYVDSKQQLEDRKVEVVKSIINHHKQWEDVTARFREAIEQENANPYSFQPILKVTVIDAQNLAPGTNSKVVVQHGSLKSETRVRVGDAPLWNEAIVFDQTNVNENLQIRLVNNRGVELLRSYLNLNDFKDYNEIDEDYWIYRDETNPQKENDAKVCIRINYHWSEVEKFATLNQQFQEYFYGDLTQYHNILSFLTKLADPFNFMSTLTAGMIDQFDDEDIQDMEEQKKLENETTAKIMAQIENQMQGISERYGYSEIPWLDLTKFFLFIELILLAFSGYYRADFLTLSGVAIAWFYILMPEKVRLTQFRSIVMLIVISLAYDIIWFMINDASSEDENGNQMRTPKRISLFFSYVSFFWKIPLIIILFKDSMDFVSIVKQKNTQTGIQSDQRIVDEYYINWKNNQICCKSHYDQDLPVNHPDAQNTL